MNEEEYKMSENRAMIILEPSYWVEKLTDGNPEDVAEQIVREIKSYHQHRLEVSEKEISQSYWKYAEETDVESKTYMEVFSSGFKACLNKLKDNKT